MTKIQENALPAPSQRAIHLERLITRDLDLRRVRALARAARFLNAARGEGIVLAGVPARDLYYDTIVALGIEDAEAIDVALDLAIEHPEAHTLIDRAERARPDADVKRLRAAAKAGLAGDDDEKARREITTAIEVSFPQPVTISNAQQQRLVELIGEICDGYEDHHPDRVMWPAGIGDKLTVHPMMLSDDEPMPFDSSVFHIEVAERERFEGEAR